MATYYEMLKVEPTASAAEIEAAYETLYNQWRHLATHHELEYRNQASQALETLETVRTTLTDPTRRSAYDAGIGLGGAVGGLADPAALLQAAGPVMTPPAPRSTVSAQPDSAPLRPGLWACPSAKCQAENPTNTKFCFKCGTQLVRECPECSRMASLVATSFCGECGYKYETAVARKNLSATIKAADQELIALRARLKKTRELENQRRNERNFSYPIMGLIISLPILAIAGSNTHALFIMVGIIIDIFALIGLYKFYLRALRLDPVSKQVQNLQSEVQNKENQLNHLNQSRRQLEVTAQ